MVVVVVVIQPTSQDGVALGANDQRGVGDPRREGVRLRVPRHREDAVRPRSVPATHGRPCHWTQLCGRDEAAEVDVTDQLQGGPGIRTTTRPARATLPRVLQSRRPRA